MSKEGVISALQPFLLDIKSLPLLSELKVSDQEEAKIFICATKGVVRKQICRVMNDWGDVDPLGLSILITSFTNLYIESNFYGSNSNWRILTWTMMWFEAAFFTIGGIYLYRTGRNITLSNVGKVNDELLKLANAYGLQQWSLSIAQQEIMRQLKIWDLDEKKLLPLEQGRYGLNQKLVTRPKQIDAFLKNFISSLTIKFPEFAKHIRSIGYSTSRGIYCVGVVGIIVGAYLLNRFEATGRSMENATLLTIFLSAFFQIRSQLRDKILTYTLAEWDIIEVNNLLNILRSAYGLPQALPPLQSAEINNQSQTLQSKKCVVWTRSCATHFIGAVAGLLQLSLKIPRWGYKITHSVLKTVTALAKKNEPSADEAFRQVYADEERLAKLKKSKPIVAPVKKIKKSQVKSKQNSHPKSMIINKTEIKSTISTTEPVIDPNTSPIVSEPIVAPLPVLQMESIASPQPDILSSNHITLLDFNPEETKNILTDTVNIAKKSARINYQRAVFAEQAAQDLQTQLALKEQENAQLRSELQQEQHRTHYWFSEASSLWYYRFFYKPADTPVVLMSSLTMDR